MSIDQCYIIELPKISDPRGNLTFIENNGALPFEVKRIFYLYDIPAQARRADHALKRCIQLLIAISGSFDILLDDGIKQQKYILNQPHYGLYIQPLTWIRLENFANNATCLVLASEPYNEQDYYRNYQDFLNEVLSR